MSNLLNHAKTELDAIGMTAEGDEYNSIAREAILELIKTFSKQGHSGFSAGYVRAAFAKLSNFEPLGPLTGSDAEWGEACDGAVFQNRRCPGVFKDVATGHVYTLDGYVFEEPDGCRFTSRDSRRNLKLPCHPPERIVVKVDENGVRQWPAGHPEYSEEQP